jgi:hypothetical protein
VFLTLVISDLRERYSAFSLADAVHLPKTWSLQILRSIGVPFWPLLNTWESLYAKGRPRSSEPDDRRQFQLEYYSGIVFLLDEWASPSQPDNKSLDELRVSANSENLFERIRTWKHDMERLRLTTCLESLEKIEGRIKGTLYAF